MITARLELVIVAAVVVCICLYDALGTIVSKLIPSESVCFGTTCFHWYSIADLYTEDTSPLLEPPYQFKLRHVGKLQEDREVFVRWMPEEPSSLFVFQAGPHVNVDPLTVEILPFIRDKTKLKPISSDRFKIVTGKRRYTFQALEEENRDDLIRTFEYILGRQTKDAEARPDGTERDGAFQFTLRQDRKRNKDVDVVIRWYPIQPSSLVVFETGSAGGINEESGEIVPLVPGDTMLESVGSSRFKLATGLRRAEFKAHESADMNEPVAAIRRVLDRGKPFHRPFDCTAAVAQVLQDLEKSARPCSCNDGDDVSRGHADPASDHTGRYPKETAAQGGRPTSSRTSSGASATGAFECNNLRQIGWTRNDREVSVQWSPRLPLALSVVQEGPASNDDEPPGEVMALIPGKTAVTTSSRDEFSVQTGRRRLSFEAPDPEDKLRCMMAIEHTLRPGDAAHENGAVGIDPGASGKDDTKRGDRHAEEAAGSSGGGDDLRHGDGYAEETAGNVSSASTAETRPTDADTDAETTTSPETGDRYGAAGLTVQSDGGGNLRAAAAATAAGASEDGAAHAAATGPPGDAATTTTGGGGSGSGGSSSSSDGFRQRSQGAGDSSSSSSSNGAPDDDPKSTTKEENVIRLGRVNLKVHRLLGFWKTWKPRELYLVSGSTLRECTVKHDKATSACKELQLDHASEVVMIDQPEHSDGNKRFVFRITTGATQGSFFKKMWLVDATTAEARDEYLSSVKDAIDRVPPDRQKAKLHEEVPRATSAGDEFSFRYALGKESSLEPAFRGNTLSPEDDSILVGQFLSTLPSPGSANVEVTDVGDLVFRAGDLPAFPVDDSPIWAHRATGSTGDKADGGAVCALMARMGVPVELTVKNGRWRVGRGLWCKMAQSAKPAGSWRIHVPGNERGKAMKNASLQIRDGPTLVLASGDDVFWSSAPS
eukprot:g2223.t1